MSETALKTLAQAGGALALAALTGCATLPDKPLPPVVAVERIRVLRAVPADARVRFVLSVRNPNAWDLSVDSLDATVTVNDGTFATGALATPVTIVAMGETRVEIDARSDFGAIAAAFERVAREKSARYEITGAIVVQNGIRLSFTRRGELPMTDFIISKP